MNMRKNSNDVSLYTLIKYKHIIISFSLQKNLIPIFLGSEECAPRTQSLLIDTLKSTVSCKT